MDLIFADLQQFMDAAHNKTSFNTLYRLSHLKKTGGHLPAQLARLAGSPESLNGQGITVWEQGNLVEIPYENLLSRDREENLHLWTVVRVLQHMSPAKQKKKEGELNLSSEDSLSLEDESELYADANAEDETTNTTIEMPGFFLQERDPAPEGFLR